MNPATKQKSMHSRVFSSIKMLAAAAGVIAVAVGGAFGQTTVFSENMGGGSDTVAIDQNTFENSSLTFSGDADTCVSDGSSGYTGASGGRNVFITSTVGKYFQIEGIDTTGYSDLVLSFGHRKSTTAGNNELDVEVSADGSSWTKLTYSRATGTGTANWTLITPAGTIPATSNLRIRFTQTSSSIEFRVDDVKLVGTYSGGGSPTPTISLSGSVTAFSTTEGTPSAAQQISVSGADLEDDILVTAPAGFEVSLDDDDYDASVLIYEVDGEVDNVTVYLRLIGDVIDSYSGDVEASSDGAATKTVAVSGAVAAVPEPTGTFTLITSVNELTDGDYVIVNSGDTFAMDTTRPGNYFGRLGVSPVGGSIVDPDASIIWRIEADGGGHTIYNDAEGVYVSYTGTSNEAHAKVSVAGDSERWTITYASGVFSVANKATPARILQYNSSNPRFACYTSAQQKLHLYKLESDEPSGPVISLGGSVTAFSTTEGTPSAAQQLSVSGADLEDDISVTAPAGFEVSLDDDDYGASVLIYEVDGEVDDVTVYVRLIGDVIDSYSGDVEASSDGAATKTVAVSGAVAAVPEPTGTFTLITSINALTDGDYVIVNSADTFAMDSNNPGNYFTTAAVQVSDGSIVNPPAALIWTIATSDGESTIYSAETGKYAAYGTASATQLKAVDSVVDDKGLWLFSYESGVFVAANKDVTTRAIMYRGDITPDRFASYALSNPYDKLHLYRLGGAEPVPAIDAPESAAALSGTYGAASASVSVEVSGTNLEDDIAVVAPVGFEVSTNDVSWGAAATFTESDGEAGGTLYIRLAASAALGGHSGDVELTSGELETVRVAVTGAVKLAAPVITGHSELTDESFTVSWSAVAGATDYVVDVYTGQDTRVLVMEESFDGFATGSVGDPSTLDVGENLDDYTEAANKGWEGYKVFSAGGAVKIGTGSEFGFIETDELDLSGNDGEFTVSFDAKAWTGDALDISLELDGVRVATVTLSDTEMRTYTVVLQGGTDASKVALSSLEDIKNRFYVDNLRVWSGKAEVIKVYDGVSSVGETSLNFDPVAPETTHYVVVRAKAGEEVSDNSEPHEVTTLESQGEVLPEVPEIVSMARDNGGVVVMFRVPALEGLEYNVDYTLMASESLETPFDEWEERDSTPAPCGDGLWMLEDENPEEETLFYGIKASFTDINV